jgi:hypothetical protein
MHTLSSIFQRLLEDSAISYDIKRMGNKKKKEISRKKANSMSKKPQMLLKLAYEYRSFLPLKVVNKKKPKFHAALLEESEHDELKYKHLFLIGC